MPTTVALRKKLCNNSKIGRTAAEIHRSAAYRLRISEDDVNIEDFLQHLYELQLMLWLAQRSDLPSLLAEFTGNSPALGLADESLSRVQQRLFELVHRTCGDCSGAKVDKLWRPILDFVAA